MHSPIIKSVSCLSYWFLFQSKGKCLNIFLSRFVNKIWTPAVVAAVKRRMKKIVIQTIRIEEYVFVFLLKSLLFVSFSCSKQYKGHYGTHHNSQLSNLRGHWRKDKLNLFHNYLTQQQTLFVNRSIKIRFGIAYDLCTSSSPHHVWWLEEDS
jgi:hypothetical protein